MSAGRRRIASAKRPNTRDSPLGLEGEYQGRKPTLVDRVKQLAMNGMRPTKIARTGYGAQLGLQAAA